MAPGVQNYTLVKRLAFRSHHHTIVLAPRTGVRFSPVKFESLEFERIELNKQVLRPLPTITALPQAVIHEKIVEDRRAEHAVLTSEPTDGGIGALCQQRRFLPVYSG